MPLLADYAITPDVFDLTSYSTEEVCGLHLDKIREVLLVEGLVRDLRQGEWREVFSATGRPWHRRARELLKKLATQGRLIRFAPALDEPPTDDKGWCAEAIGTQEALPFTGGVIVSDQVKRAFASEPLVARVDRLASTPWWAVRSSSVRLPRSLTAYREHLDPVLRCASSIMLVDPHLDPARPGYREIGDLLAHAGGRTPAPAIEVHRVCYEGSGPRRRFPMKDSGPTYFEKLFRDALEPKVRASGLRVEVFVWDEFHDRFLISNLIGISVPNGFDTTRDASSITRWTRLGRDDRDDVQREFDPASGRHALRDRFLME